MELSKDSPYRLSSYLQLLSLEALPSDKKCIEKWNMLCPRQFSHKFYGFRERRKGENALELLSFAFISQRNLNNIVLV
jgi:hypothetical protein